MEDKEIISLDNYKEMLQINTNVVLKKDIKKIAKEHNITRHTLLKILAAKGYEYDRKSKGYICIKSATEHLKTSSATLEDNINKFIKFQLDFNKNILEKSHILDDMSHCDQRSDKDEIIDVEANLMPNEEWSYSKKSIKVDEKVWESYIKVCERKYKGLKRQEITTIVLDKFVRENL